MNELQRQHYLSVLGVDTYMPRWQLPFAPQSVLCKLPQIVDTASSAAAEVKLVLPIESELDSNNSPAANEIKITPQVNSLISNIFEPKKTVANPLVKVQPTSAADILAHLDSKPSKIEAFSLSVWRPINGLMIVDSRNSKLALPTEILLNNILRSFFSNQFMQPQEEILRWPMIENSFAKRTADDARNELQTWLSVQHEIRPIHYLWLMGSNASTYLLSEQLHFSDLVFQTAGLNDSVIKALILPSLNEVLQKPAIKQKLFSAIRRYHSSSL